MKPGPWHVEFEEFGGYDCMSASYDVCAANGELVVSVDVRGYTESREYDDLHARNPEAEDIANRIAAIGGTKAGGV